MKRTAHSKELFDNQDRQGAIIKKPGSSNLYVLFYYYGRRIEKTTGLKDTKKNREKTRSWLDRVIEQRDAGKLIFAQAFPGAPEEEKAAFAKLEGWDYTPQPRDVLFRDYVKHWRETVWVHFSSETNKITYKVAIESWLLPHFGEMLFSQITSVELQRFMATFQWRRGKNKGKPLSRARAKNIITVLRTIINDAADEYQWTIPDPFRNVKRYLPKTPPREREVFRFDEWQRIVQHIDPWFKPMVEVMVLTGMIHSEISGLRKEDIKNGQIFLQNSIVLDIESNVLKSKYRRRKIPVTAAIKRRLDEAINRTDSQYVFANPDGTPYRRVTFIKTVWEKALKKGEVFYHTPYSMRHTFAAWALTLRVDPLRLVRLMGHGSKQMIFDTYGNYVEGLEQDLMQILEYFGRDFLDTRPTTGRLLVLDAERYDDAENDQQQPPESHPNQLTLF